MFIIFILVITNVNFCLTILHQQTMKLSLEKYVLIGFLIIPFPTKFQPNIYKTQLILWTGMVLTNRS